MVDDDLRVGEGAGKVQSVAELAGIDHHVEGQIEPPQQAEAAPPRRILHQVGALGEAPGRIPMPAQDLADTAHVGLRAVGLQHRFRVRLLQARVGDDPVGEAALVGDALQPAGLGGRVVLQKTRLDMDRLDQIYAGHVRQIVVEQIVADERRGAAEHHLAGAVGEPRIATGLEIPEVMVGVDDRPVIEAGHGVLRFSLPARTMAAQGRT